MSESIANKYRPKEFSEVVGQPILVDIISSQILRKSLSNCILFIGPAGTGKTTIARLIAKAVNGSITEIDAASHNGVDSIRDLQIRAQQYPLDGDYNVFILDEVHALSSAAWQASLKIIEEPPAKSIFIFCTTEEDKIPQTIISRVQKYRLNRIQNDLIEQRLKYVLEKEGITDFESNAVSYIAKLSKGGLRDALTYLEKCINYSSSITLDNVISALGTINYDCYFELLEGIIMCDIKGVIDIVEKAYNSGKDLKLFIREFWSFTLDVAKYNIFKSFDYIQIPNIYSNNLNKILGCIGREIDTEFIPGICERLYKLSADIKYISNVKETVEVSFMGLCK